MIYNKFVAILMSYLVIMIPFVIAVEHTEGQIDGVDPAEQTAAEAQDEADLNQAYDLAEVNNGDLNEAASEVSGLEAEINTLANDISDADRESVQAALQAVNNQIGNLNTANSAIGSSTTGSTALSAAQFVSNGITSVSNSISAIADALANFISINTVAPGFASEIVSGATNGNGILSFTGNLAATTIAEVTEAIGHISNVNDNAAQIVTTMVGRGGLDFLIDFNDAIDRGINAYSGNFYESRAFNEMINIPNWSDIDLEGMRETLEHIGKIEMDNTVFSAFLSFLALLVPILGLVMAVGTLFGALNQGAGFIDAAYESFVPAPLKFFIEKNLIRLGDA